MKTGPQETGQCAKDSHESNGNHGGGVFSSGKNGHWRQKRHRNTTSAREKRRADWKEACKSVEQAENHEKGPRWSWARNQRGNRRLTVRRPAPRRLHTTKKGNAYGRYERHSRHASGSDHFLDLSIALHLAHRPEDQGRVPMDGLDSDLEPLPRMQDWGAVWLVGFALSHSLRWRNRCHAASFAASQGSRHHKRHEVPSSRAACEFHLFGILGISGRASCDSASCHDVRLTKNDSIDRSGHGGGYKTMKYDNTIN